MACAGHPLGGLADVADDGGWFSLAQKCQGQQPSYIKTKYKPNLSQLGPWPLKGHLYMRTLAAGRWEQLGWPSAVLVLGVRGGQNPSGLPLGVQWGPLGGWQGDIALAVRHPPPPGGLTRHAKFRIAQGPTKVGTAGKCDLCMPTEGPPLQTAVKYETPASVRPQKWPLWRSDSPPPTVLQY